MQPIIRPVELGLQLQVGEDRGVAVVVEAHVLVGIDDEGHRHAGDEAAVAQPDLRPVMAFERLDLDAGDLDADAPGRGADLLGGDAAVHQPGLDLAAADDRAAVLRGDLVGVAEMVEGRVADHHQIDLVEARSISSRRPGFWSRNGSQQDAQAVARSGSRRRRRRGSGCGWWVCMRSPVEWPPAAGSRPPEAATSGADPRAFKATARRARPAPCRHCPW